MASISNVRQKCNQDRKDKTYQELMNAAIEVFNEKGYHDTLISDIVAKAGVGQGTFYRNFKSKRELFDSIMDRFGNLLLGQFEFMSAHLPTNVEEYRKASLDAVLAMARIVDENRKLVLVLLREGPTVDREFDQRLQELMNQFAGLAAFYLEHAIEKGFTRTCNPAIVSQALVGIALRHITLWLYNEERSIDLPELISELVDFAFFGFGT